MRKKLIIGLGILIVIVVGVLMLNYSGKNKDVVNESLEGQNGTGDSGANFEEQYYQNLEEFFHGEENGYENIYGEYGWGGSGF